MSNKKTNPWSLPSKLVFRISTILEHHPLMQVLLVSFLYFYTSNTPILAYTPDIVACPIDTVAPVITNCPNSVSVAFDASICGAIHTWPAIVATDNCDPSPIITSNYMSGDTFHQSDLVVILATDSVGLVDTCSFYVTVTNSGFIVNCPATIHKDADANCQATVSWPNPTIQDDCNSNPTLTSSHMSGTKFDIDTTTVYIYASNSLGNKDTCSFQVIVKDVTPPFITGCDLDTTIYPIGCTGVYVWNEDLIIVHDNCNAVKIPDPIYHSGYNFPMGTTTVTYKALDADSLDYTCTFDVTVIDTVGPIATYCPNDTVVTVFGCDTVVTWNNAIFVDGCDPSTTMTQNFNPGDSFPLGVYTIEYTAQDGNGNSGNCSFHLTVKDNTPPNLSPCPSDTTIFVTTNCEAVYTYKMPDATDLCSGTITPTASPSTTTFSVGTHLITISATDDGGNMSQCSFTVIAKDTASPTTICPQGIQINTNGDINNDPSNIISNVTAVGCAMPMIDFSFPPIVDNCEAMLTDSSVLSSSFPLGTTAYTYNFTDPYGNGQACTFQVEVLASVQTITIAADQNPICPGSTVTLSASYTSATAQYAWTGPQSFVSTSSTPIINNFSFQNAGDYMVTITDGGCELQPAAPLQLSLSQAISASDDAFSMAINTSDTINVLSNDNLSGQNCTVQITQAPLNGNAQIVNNKIVYTPDAAYTGSDHIFYEVCVENCSDFCASAQIDIEINLTANGDTCIIPNLITPNDDNLNDALILDCLTSTNENSKIMIYNQWGGLVFEAAPYLNDWSGSFDHNSERPLPDGTYFYIFWKDKSKAPQKGFITLFR